jgi:uncharacterized damage-inducible protein DinB
MAGEVNKLSKSIQRAWDEVDAFLTLLSDEQKIAPRDNGGWAVKDHLIHMAVWEDGIEALLSGESREARMGIESIVPKPRGDDAINDVIFKQYKDRSLQDVMATRQAIHDRLLATLQSLRDEDLTRPYSSFASGSRNNQAIEGHILGNTSGHYRKHLKWMKALVEKE